MKKNINDLMELDPGYEVESIFVQLNKILDNESCRDVVKAEKFNPDYTVKTEDQEVFTVPPEVAQGLINFLNELDVRDRTKMLQFIQYAKGLETLLKCSNTLH